jgi:hypothetical protein
MRAAWLLQGSTRLNEGEYHARTVGSGRNTGRTLAGQIRRDGAEVAARQLELEYGAAGN